MRSEIPGEHPALEGDAALVRIMRYHGKKGVEGKREASGPGVRFDGRSGDAEMPIDRKADRIELPAS